METPVALFDASGALPYCGVSADGQRFLLAQPVQTVPAPFTVVLNWQ